MLDEMSITKHIEFVGVRNHGYVDIGAGDVAIDNNRVAT